MINEFLQFFTRASRESQPAAAEPVKPAGIRKKNTVRRNKEAFTLINTATQQFLPAASSFYNIFYNPMEIYSYICKNHPVAYRCIDIIREEIANDGYVLRHLKTTTKKRLIDAHRTLKKMDFSRLRLDTCSHLKIYGNAWLVKKYDPVSKTTKLELLSPTKVVPRVNETTDEIIGWWYYRGSKTIDYKLDEVYHLYMFNSDNYKRIGDPPLQAALIDIETDLAQKNFNREVLEKGFMGSVIFSVEPPDLQSGLEDDIDDIVEEWQDRIDAELSGAKAANQGLVMTNLKSVENVSPIGSFEGSFIDSSKEKAKIICMCLGVPSEKLGIARSENQQYVATLVEYGVNASFDKSIYYVVNYVDEFFTEVLLNEILKITDLEIEAGGRFGSLTKTAAEVIEILAKSGPLITVNQALEMILGWEALPPDNPRGNFVLDTSIGRKADSTPLLVNPEKVELDLDPITGSGNTYKQMHWDEFIQLTNSYKEASCTVFNKKKEVTTGEDSDPANILVYKKGRARIFCESSYN